MRIQLLDFFLLSAAVSLSRQVEILEISSNIQAVKSRAHKSNNIAFNNAAFNTLFCFKYCFIGYGVFLYFESVFYTGLYPFPIESN